MPPLSPYATELALARLDALRSLLDALNSAEDPAEKRRCAVAIFNAPDPSDIDDSVELFDDDQDDPDDHQQAPSVNERAEELPTPTFPAIDVPSCPPCNNNPISPATSPNPSPPHPSPHHSRAPLPASNILDILTPLPLHAPKHSPPHALLSRAGTPLRSDSLPLPLA